MNKRDTVKKIKAGSVEIGGGAPVSVQTMCNTKTWDVDATVAQIKAMQTAGADIVRIALPDMESAKAVSAIKEQVSVPLVADIHFDYRLALEAAERGIDKIRINPGNIGAPENVSRRGLPPAQYPHPHRRERGQPRKGSARKVRPPLSGSSRRER